MDIFHNFLYIPIFNLLIVFYRTFGDLGIALILIAVLSRLITIPITNRQLKSTEKNKEYQSKLSQLKKTYKNNQKRLEEETMKLHSEYLPGQLGGCLPMILQLLFFVQIFNVLNNLFQKGVVAFNEVAYDFVGRFPEGAEINRSFLGGIIDLGKSASTAMTELGLEKIVQVLPYLILVVFVIISQYYSSRILTGTNQAKKKEEEKSKMKDRDKKDEPDAEEMTQLVNQQMSLFLPVMIGIFSYNSPAGLALYWTIQSSFVIIQTLISKRKEVADVLQKFLKRFTSQDANTNKKDGEQKAKTK